MRGVRVITAVTVVVVGLGINVKAASSSPQDAKPLALTANGIDGIDLGTTQSVLFSKLDALLGSHGRLDRDAGDTNCGYDAEVDWRDLQAFFFDGRLVGYQYSLHGENGGVAAIATGGLRVGEPVRRLRQLFGRALSLSEAQGGAYFVATSAGKLDGYLTDETYQKDARVASIDAGLVGCPAMSP